MPDDERIEAAEYIGILREAAAARNGWKRILVRCAPAPRRIASAPESLQAEVPVATADARARVEMIRRAFILVAGPSGAGKTALIEHLLCSERRTMIAERSIRDDTLHEPIEKTSRHA